MKTGKSDAWLFSTFPLRYKTTRNIMQYD